MENASFREATGELAGQIASLQAAVDEIGARAAVDPDADRAMSGCPRACANGRWAARPARRRPVLSGAFGAPDNTFGVLRDMLGVIENRLAIVRTGVERRQALASATPSIWPVAGWISSVFGNRRDPFTGGADFHPGLDISGDHGPADPRAGRRHRHRRRLQRQLRQPGHASTTASGSRRATGTCPGSPSAPASRSAAARSSATSASTGRSTSSHLHYEVLVNGQLTNPLNLLSGR